MSILDILSDILCRDVGLEMGKMPSPNCGFFTVTWIFANWLFSH